MLRIRPAHGLPWRGHLASRRPLSRNGYPAQLRRKPIPLFGFSTGSRWPKRNKKGAPEVCQKHDRRERPEKGKHDQMQNQNWAARKIKAKGGGQQAKQPTTRSICREVKVVTVREEPIVGKDLCASPGRIAYLWRETVAGSAWYHEDKEHVICVCLDTRSRIKSFSLISIGSLNEC